MLLDDPELISDFVDEASDHLDTIDSVLLELERSPKDPALRGQMTGVFHTLKGMAGYVEFTELEELCHLVETVMDRLGSAGASQPVLDLMFDIVTGLRDRFDELREHSEGGGALPASRQIGVLRERLRRVA